MPKISVVMPVYNGEKYLREAIDSILNQTFSDFEFIIINDASKDGTEEIIKSYEDDRIVYLKNEQNLGVAGTLNRGLGVAKGEYIARMDSDDISLPERLKKQVEYMDKHKDVGVLGTDILIFGEGIEEREFIFSHKKEQVKAELFLKSSVAHPTVMIRNSILKSNHLKYTEKYNGFEDFALWWDVVKYSNIEVLPEILLKYRQHISQVTKKHKAYYKDVYREFFDERISLFGLENEASKELLYRYCTSDYGDFNEKDINELIGYFRKLISKNAEIKIFNQKAFKNNITAVLYRIISASELNEKVKKNVIYKAMKNGALLRTVYFKIVLRKMFEEDRRAK